MYIYIYIHTCRRHDKRMHMWVYDTHIDRKYMCMSGEGGQEGRERERDHESQIWP